MAYSTSNPPALLIQRVGSGIPTGTSNTGSKGGGSLWSYASTDNAAAVNTAGYISNGDDLGMELGDVVYIFDTDAPLVTHSFVSAITAGGSVNLTSF